MKHSPKGHTKAHIKSKKARHLKNRSTKSRALRFKGEAPTRIHSVNAPKAL